MTKKTVKKAKGRPPSANPRTRNLCCVRVTPDELQQFRNAAESRGESLAVWVRDALHTKLSQPQESDPSIDRTRRRKASFAKKIQKLLIDKQEK